MSQSSFDAVWGVVAEWSCFIGGAWVLQEALNIHISKDCRAKFFTDLCNSQWLHQLSGIFTILFDVLFGLLSCWSCSC